MPLLDELEFAVTRFGSGIVIRPHERAALDDLGGSPDTDDVTVFNRLTEELWRRLAAFRDAIATERPSLLVLTRVAVTYDLMPVHAILPDNCG